MNASKVPMPADGSQSAGNAHTPDGVNSAADDVQGNAYPNPHTGKTERGDGGKLSSPLSHGGQSEIAYHGTGQLGAQDTGDDNVNATTDER